ncbi:hypothetical protein SprV_0301178300 [Sparganum proliferum]
MVRPQVTALGRFYGLPKVHKDGAPLRSIVLLKGTPTYGLAKWLFRRLKFPTAESDTTVSSSAQYLEKLKGDLAIETIEAYFTFDGTIYEQVKATPMGLPISGFIAEAVLQRLESLVFQHHKPKFWARTSSCQLQHPDYTNPLSSSQTLPRHPRRQLTLTALPSHHFHPSSSLSSSSIASKSAAAAPVPLTPARNPDTPTNVSPPPPPTTLAMLTRSIRVLVATSNSPHTSAWSVTCESISQRLASQCLEHQLTFTSAVHTAPRTCTHYMGLFGHVRIRESGIDPSLDTPSNSCTSTMSSSTQTLPSSMTTISSSTTATIPETDTPDLPCPQCPRTFTSHIGLVSHLQIHREETGEPVPGAPTYTHRTRLHCPHCPRTFTHRMGLFGHRRIHEHLR